MWPIIRYPRSVVAYGLAAVGVIVAHIMLCHGAATCRGHPPLRPNELIAAFIAPFFVGVPALFDDRRETRQWGVICMSLGMAFVYGIVIANLSTARPHTGHLAGMQGVIQHHWPMVITFSFVPFFALWFSLWFLERVTGDLWGIVRRFSMRDTDGDQTAA